MKLSATALALAGVAAAGPALVTSGASHGAPARETRAAARCTPGAVSGEAVRVTSVVKIGRKHPQRARLRARTWIATGKRGSAEICLARGRTWCSVRPLSLVEVLPRMPNSPLLRVAKAPVPVVCSTSAGGRVAAGGHMVWLQDPRLLASGPDAAAAARPGAVFSLTVRNRSTVVKMWRGASVVSRVTTIRGGVVLGRRQRVLARRGSDPQRPAPFQPSSSEKKAFAAAERPLGREPDRTPPVVTLAGPPDPSSLRSAVFTFTSNEPGTVFSCGFDGEVPRMCTSPVSRRVGPGRHRFELRAVDPAGNVRTIVRTWTVDASRVVFASNRDGNADIYVVEPDGSNERRLTQDPRADEAPEWSPDGSRIAFHRRGAGTDVYVMDADGANERRITAIGATDRNPAWSPDGRRLAFESDRGGELDIFVADLSAGVVTRPVDMPGANFDPAWSPDGSRIAFASTRDGNEEVYVMNADGSGQRRLTVNPGPDFNPAWSPDGRRLAFHSRRGGAPQHVYVMDADGANVVELTKTPLNDHNPAWSPDGTAIVFQREVDRTAPTPRMALFYVLADGSGETRLVESSGNDYDPDW